uniref:serine C-palmitoyltransferase n=1 Tax=Lepeophtheirus salmonis TaxID=72036 RepID=A0A0K2T0M8_LEPSM
MTQVIEPEPSRPLIEGNDMEQSLSSKEPPCPGDVPPKRRSIHARGHHDKCPLYVALCSYLSYCIIFLVGIIRESIFGIPSKTRETNREGYSPLYASFESFYTRNVFRRLKDSFSHPIASVPGATVKIIGRSSNDHFWSFKMVKSQVKTCINLGSYNYLGFAENNGSTTEATIQEIKDRGLTTCSPRMEYGTSAVHVELERTVSDFIGSEDAITFGMGFATNCLNIPAIVGKKCLVLSDEFNHASIILGLRLSGATVMVFKHNNVDNLDKIIRQAIIRGHPRTRRPWKKILIMVEGVYSMEGSIVRLPEIVAIKKKYGAYLYLDEAHSVGAMGRRGRGIVDYFDLNPKDIDILMGTFTKSFGAAGGYIAGSKTLISYLRTQTQAGCYASSISPPIARQVIASMNAVMYSIDGLKRIHRLLNNSRYFRENLKKLGFIVYGHIDSPVVPLLLFMPSKIQGFVNEMMHFNIATVGVGFPATPITEERVRFCMSAGHSKEMLDEVLSVIDRVGDQLRLKYSSRKRDPNRIIPYYDF